MKLIFSDISFQAHDDEGYVNSTEDFLYLYYTVEIYALDYDYDENGSFIQQWQLVKATSTHDFPAIIGLQNILRQYLSDDIPEKDCQVVHYYHDGEIAEDRIGYVYSMDTDNWFHDDYYQMERTIVKEQGKETGREYSFYVGGAISAYGRGSSAGVKISISESGIRSLLKCITTFLNDAIDSHNQAVRKFLSSEKYSIDKEHRIIGTENGKLTEMFLQDDVVSSISIYCGNLDSDSFYSESYHNVKISEIKENEIIITGGYCEHRHNNAYNDNEPEDRQLSISIKNIFHIFTDITEDVLKLNEQGIADEFRAILTKEELTDIQNNNLEENYQKWFEVIVDRYIIFREEHPFRKTKTDERENAMEAVRTVLQILKE